MAYRGCGMRFASFFLLAVLITAPLSAHAGDAAAMVAKHETLGRRAQSAIAFDTVRDDALAQFHPVLAGQSRVFGPDGGAVGLDFLRHFNQTIDYPHSRFLVTPNNQ